MEMYKYELYLDGCMLTESEYEFESEDEAEDEARETAQDRINDWIADSCEVKETVNDFEIITRSREESDEE